MADVDRAELEWIRLDTSSGPALSSALPAGFAVYGALDVAGDDPIEDHALLAALAPDPDEVLVAGVLVRSIDEQGEPGAEHRLYADWPYRFRRLRVAEVHGRIDGDGLSRFKTTWRLPEIVFPADRRFLVSTLWDDEWRSIGTDDAVAQRIEAALPAFERIGREVDLNTTGRHPY